MPRLIYNLPNGETEVYDNYREAVKRWREICYPDPNQNTCYVIPGIILSNTKMCLGKTEEETKNIKISTTLNEARAITGDQTEHDMCSILYDCFKNESTFIFHKVEFQKLLADLEKLENNGTAFTKSQLGGEADIIILSIHTKVGSYFFETKRDIFPEIGCKNYQNKLDTFYGNLKKLVDQLNNDTALLNKLIVENKEDVDENALRCINYLCSLCFSGT